MDLPAQPRYLYVKGPGVVNGKTTLAISSIGLLLTIGQGIWVFSRGQQERDVESLLDDMRTTRERLIKVEGVVESHRGERLQQLSDIRDDVARHSQAITVLESLDARFARVELQHDVMERAIGQAIGRIWAQMQADRLRHGWEPLSDWRFEIGAADR